MFSAPSDICDYRNPKEADAQSLRAAVLIDEMTEDVVRSGSGSIVMEMRGGLRGLKLAQYACTQRVFPVPTTQMNARRCVLKGAEQPATCVSSSANHNRDQTLHSETCLLE